MERGNFDDIWGEARRALSLFQHTFKEITGEEFELESAIRHYPLVAVGVAAGVGALGGWWIGRRSAPPPRQLPPPPPTGLNRALHSARDMGERLRERRATAPPDAPPSPLDYLEVISPEQAERLRRALPPGTADEAARKAREWLEPTLQEGIERVVKRTSGTTFGSFLRETLDRFANGEDQHLDDPAEE